MSPLTIASWLEPVPFNVEYGGITNNDGGLIARDLSIDHINTKWGCGVYFSIS